MNKLNSSFSITIHQARSLIQAT